MKIAILGAGVMGRNIARVYLQANLAVTLYSQSRATLDSAGKAIGDAAKGNLLLTSSIEEAVREADFILESVPEIMELKHRVLTTAERANEKNAIIGTNTSSLPLEELAQELRFPDRFLGVHWFNPAHLIPLVEVVPTGQTDGDVVKQVVENLVSVGKRPIALDHAIPGFIANRLQYALIREALHLLDQGVTNPEQIDLALTECLGLRWAVAGPMQTTDLAGIDTAIAVARELYPKLAADTFPQQVLLDVRESGGTFFDNELGAIARMRDEGLVRILKAREQARSPNL